jgi:hypothetical protein
MSTETPVPSATKNGPTSSQLYQRPWLNEIRDTTIDHLVLGSAFSWSDTAAYAVGVLLGSLIDTLLVGVARFRAGRRLTRLQLPRKT